MSFVGGKKKKLGADRNVVRYVGGASISLGPSAGEFEIGAGAFERSTKDEDGLSFIERFVLAKQSKADEDEIRRILASRRSFGKTAQFAELNVGRALEALSYFDNDFYFCEDPLPEDGERLANPAHVLLIGLPFKGELAGSMTSELAGELLSGAVERLFPAMHPKTKK
ncbi:MAG: hypothetical protein AABY88_04775 [Pseudomonadota bacterium]